MTLSKTLVALAGAGSLLIAGPVMAADNAASLLSISSSSQASGSGVATPFVKKGKRFSETAVGILIAALVGGAVLYLALDDENGSPASP